MIAVVSHDAGGAEVLSSYVRRAGLTAVYALEGPAQAVFARKLGSISSLSISEAVGAAAWVLCGTSWQSDLELQAIRLAQSVGKRAVAFIDHWVNYRERFQRGGLQIIPDEIWVCDAYGLEIARRELPGLPVSIVDNPYLIDIQSDLSAASARRERHPRPEGARFLWIGEPIAAHAALRFGDERHWGYTERDAISFFLEHVRAIAEPVDSVVFRPHPAETSDKYDWIWRETSLQTTVSSNKFLVDEIAESDIVIGCNSMAMVVALLGGKRVVSCIPPGGQRCLLPHRNIEHLRDMLRPNSA